MSHPPIARKRRWLAPVVIVSVLLILVLAAFAIAEKLARDAAADLLRAPIQQAFSADSEIAVEFGPGSVILQALGGAVDQVTVSADGVALGPASGDIDLEARGVPLNPEGSIETLSAELHLDAASLQPLVAAVAATPATAAFVDQQLMLTTQTEIAGQSRSVEVLLTPETASGRLIFSVDALTIDGEDVSVESARAGAYGPEAAALVASPSLCVAEHLPASLALDSATVAGQRLTLVFSGADVALAGGGLATKGACPEAG